MSATRNRQAAKPGRRKQQQIAAARQRRRRRIWLAVGAMAVIVVVVAVVASFRSAPSTAASGVRTTSTDWALPSFTEGQTITLAQFRGKPVVVNFFASWCTQCDAELPGFAKLSQELRGQVTFVGVNSLETGDRNYMVQRHHIDWWPLAADQGGRNGSGLHDALGARAGSMPLTAFYDSGGQLVDVALGALDESSLRARVAKLNTAAAPRGSGPLAR